MATLPVGRYVTGGALVTTGGWSAMNLGSLLRLALLGGALGGLALRPRTRRAAATA